MTPLEELAQAIEEAHELHPLTHGYAGSKMVAGCWDEPCKTWTRVRDRLTVAE